MLSEVRNFCISGSAESVEPAASRGLSGMPVQGASPLDPFDTEALILNLDASLRVHARSQFVAWTQGPLHRLLRQEVLICVLPAGAPSSFRIDCFSTRVTDASVFSRHLARDTSLAPKLIEGWRAHGRRPVLSDLVQSDVIGHSALASALERVAATQVVMHGCHDAAGKVTGFFVFASRAGTLSPRHLYHVQLVVPFLHTAWTRAQLNAWPRIDTPAQTRECAVTTREQEVLKWIYLGKTNPEIGCILGISALTVRDHVRNLLRKLNVVNRTQAVGRALEAQLL
ncbi:MAG TPA: XrtB/PEP-CTERM-associated transcriptional regulator EpsA [Burkholderiaceae bacterium]